MDLRVSGLQNSIVYNSRTTLSIGSKFGMKVEALDISVCWYLRKNGKVRPDFMTFGIFHKKCARALSFAHFSFVRSALHLGTAHCVTWNTQKRFSNELTSMKRQDEVMTGVRKLHRLPLLNICMTRANKIIACSAPQSPICTCTWQPAIYPNLVTAAY